MRLLDWNVRWQVDGVSVTVIALELCGAMTARRLRPLLTGRSAMGSNL